MRACDLGALQSAAELIGIGAVLIGMAVALIALRR